MLPSTFLPPAEESELIVQIGNWVLHAACAQAEIWRRNGITIPISVNVSARELTELDLAERVREELGLLSPARAARCAWRSARRRCCATPSGRARRSRTSSAWASLIALDNFGYGQSSLGLPSNLPLDVVKLDRALTGSFHQDKERRAMFAATIALAKEAGLTAVAVGIETNRQLALARELDCAVGQGFLLHGPASAGSRSPQRARPGR